MLALAVNDVDGVLRVLDIFETPDNSTFILILERPVDSIDLFDFISQRSGLDEPTSRHFFKQAVEIVTRVFERGVFHNDIKDENFVIDMTSMRLKLIDFGAALRYDPNSRIQRVYTAVEFNGTRIWSPPEFIAEKRFRAESTTVWTLGCLLFDMICGDIPFREEEDIVSVSFKYFRVMPSPSTKDLIERCMRRRPEERIRLRDILDHPFCRGR